MLQTGYGVQHLKLHLLGHGGGKALNIQLVRVKSHRLDEKLMALFIGKTDDLRFDTRAVARADALDDAGVDRASVQILTDDAVRLLARVGQVAHRLVARRSGGGK